LGAWIVLIFLILLQTVEVSEGVRNIFVAIAIPLLIGGAWWAIVRADRFSDEFELANTRQMDSIAFRFLVFWILAGEFLEAAGTGWDLFDGFTGLTLSVVLGLFLTHRRTYRRKV
jgi:hypothetical protein